jgi:hypothetical protein
LQLPFFLNLNWLVKQFTPIKIETSLEFQKIFLKNSKIFYKTTGCGLSEGQKKIDLCARFNRIHANKGLVTFPFSEFDETIAECKQSVVFTDAYILSCVILCSALANDDVACDRRLAAIDLYSQPLALRVAAVLYTTFTFFVSHILEFEIVLRPKPPEAA